MSIAEAYFTFLNKNNISYVIVGDTRGYPQNIDSDVDIVVNPRDLPKMGKLLLRFCMECEQLSLVQVLQHEHTAWYFVLAFHDEKNNLVFLQPDICGDYLRNGIFMLSAGEMLKNRIEAIDDKGMGKGFYVPEPKMEFIYYLLKKIDKQEIDARHCVHLTEEWKKDPVGCKRQVGRFWNGNYSEILTHAAESNEWGAVESTLSNLQRTLHKALSFSLVARWKDLLRMFFRVLRPTGLFVVILGTDGSGKSSVIKEVMHDLSPAFRKTHYIHLRPKIGLKINETAVPVTDPHKQDPRGLSLSMAKCLYFLFDYGIGYLAKVRPLLVRSTFVVFDRYYHDMLVDRRRYRYGGPLWFARWIGRFIPKADLVILLDAPAEILQSRKQEVSFEETARQRKLYLELVGDMKNGMIIDASRPLDMVVADVNKVVLNFMANRVESRINYR